MCKLGAINVTLWGPAMKNRSALYSWCRGYQNWPITAAFSPHCPIGSYLSGWLPHWEISHNGAMWLPPGVAKDYSALGSPLITHLKWHLSCLEKGSTCFQPPPSTKWCNGFRDSERPPFLPAVLSFPLGQYTDLKGEGGRRFQGSAQYMYSLTFLFGYKTIKGVNFKCVLMFLPSCLHGEPMF